MGQIFREVAWKVVTKVRDDAVRDLMVKHFKIDYDVADRLAGMLMNVVDQSAGMLKTAVEDQLSQTRIYKQAALLYYARQLRQMQQELADNPPAGDLRAVLEDENS